MKKRMILVAFLVVYSGAAHAKDVCNPIGDIAGTIMEARQAGVEMSKLMGLTQGSRITKFIVIAAFKKPRFGTKEYRDNSVINFKNEVYLGCIRGLNK